MMKSLKAQGKVFSNTQPQLDVLEKNGEKGKHFPRFEEKLQTYGMFPLKPAELTIMQINVGKMCNQTCTHCHVDAGPDRKEIMSRETMRHCLDALRKAPSVHTVDLTGGAPEMNPEFTWFVDEISKLEKKTIVRSNLTILESNKRFQSFPDFFARNKVTVIASLPCYTAGNTDKQRGNGVFQKSIAALKRLNEVGYGSDHSGLELNLVYNPDGASLPPPQENLQSDYKRILFEKFGIIFNNLYALTNLPISRFLDYLLAKGNYEEYMEKLVNAFNPATLEGLMCRNTLSVSWDGYLYDCDFNQMLELHIGKGNSEHICEFTPAKIKDRNIIVKQHCFGCTAGAGSSCQGSIL